MLYKCTYKVSQYFHVKSEVADRVLLQSEKYIYDYTVILHPKNTQKDK